MYLRTNMDVFFMWPSLALGVDIDGQPFIEMAFAFWAIGIGDKP